MLLLHFWAKGRKGAWRCCGCVLSKSQTTEMWVGICPGGAADFFGAPKLKLQLCLRLAFVSHF